MPLHSLPFYPILCYAALLLLNAKLINGQVMISFRLLYLYTQRYIIIIIIIVLG